MDPADEFHSPYTYVGGDPVNLVDPDGRQAAQPGCGQNGPTKCNANAESVSSAAPVADITVPQKHSQDLDMGNALLGTGMALDQVAGYGNAINQWDDYFEAPRRFTRTRIFLENLVNRDMGKVRRIAKFTRFLGRASTVAGIGSNFYKATNNPEYLLTPDFAITAGSGVVVLVTGPVTGTLVTIGGLGYLGADYYCDGASTGACGTFNEVTESTYMELFEDFTE